MRIRDFFDDPMGKKQIKRLKKQVYDLQHDKNQLLTDLKKEQETVAKLKLSLDTQSAEINRLASALEAERAILKDAKVAVSLAAQENIQLERLFDVYGHVKGLEEKNKFLESQCRCGCPACNPAPVPCKCGCMQCCQVVPGRPQMQVGKNNGKSGGDDDEGSGPRLHPAPSFDGGIFGSPGMN